MALADSIQGPRRHPPQRTTFGIELEDEDYASQLHEKSRRRGLLFSHESWKVAPEIGCIQFKGRKLAVRLASEGAKKRKAIAQA